MLKKLIALLFLFISAYGFSQTTDLAISVEAQDLLGNDISQVHIFEEFQYIVTISNVGNSVTNAVFSQSINLGADVISFTSQNPVGGATLITDLSLDNFNVLTGTIASLPASSSIEVKVVLKAPEFIGGIATEVNIMPPSNVTDTSPSNNTSIISIDVTDTPIDFTVTHTQISPVEGVPINAWNDIVTYQFTITNNSVIDFPLSDFTTYLELNTPQVYGEPYVLVQSIECINSTNGTACINDIDIPTDPVFIDANAVIPVLYFEANHLFTSGGSLTFEIVYQYLEPACATDLEPIDVTSFVGISINHANESSNISNSVITNLIEANLCQETDVCIETIQINPAVGIPINWNEEVTFETTICNNGPLDADVLASFRNISNNVLWDIISIECIQTDTTIPCSNLTFADADQYWVSNTFNLAVGEIVTVQTVIIFLEPECAVGSTETEGIIRTFISIESEDIFDSFLLNNTDVDYVTLPSAPECESSDIGVFKTQISPSLPEGSDMNNTTSWGIITYEIEVVNFSDEDIFFELIDYMPPINASNATGILESVECVSTTGSATCFPIEHANIDVALDGVPDDDDNPDVFWEILSEDNWELPANSSVVFQVTVNWLPECSASAIMVQNSVSVEPSDPFVDLSIENNENTVSSFFAPCLDLVVQTFPEFPSVIVNDTFNWIVDITNSATSSTALDVLFEDEVDSPFTIVGTPTCQVTFGTATCMSSFNVAGNTITGTIPIMEAGSTVRIIIPVEAPPYGGAFINMAQAFPSDINNEELTPETNISISSVQVIAPTLVKVFEPDEIFVGEESVLTFTINNLISNPSQNNISFIDNLPNGITISGDPFWVETNGCTATFIGVIGSSTFEVNNLTFPEGVGSCSFSIPVTSNIAGEYINNNSNFTDQINLDTSQANASLVVLDDNSDVDIEVLKSVTPQLVSIGDQVAFTITATNLGTTPATLIEIYDELPQGYSYVSSNATLGDYDVLTFIWSIPFLEPNQTETLTIVAQVNSTVNLLNIAFLESVTETDQNNTNNEDDAEVTVDGCLEIPQVFTPNNDGLNDTFIIPCIEDYPNTSLKIYNRYGTKVYESNNYINTWNGKPNQGLLHQDSKLLPVGTYYYIVNQKDLGKPIIGWVYLNY